MSSAKWRVFCLGLNVLLMVIGLYETALHWRHNDHDAVSNHQPHGCLLSRLFRRRSKKTSKLCVTGLCVGNSPGPVNSPHKGPVTRKIFPFDDVIMECIKSKLDCSGRDDLSLTACTHMNKWIPLLWRHNERDSVSNHQRLYCLLKRLFRRRSKVTSKLRVTGLCAWNSPGTAQKASNAENVSIWWRHHEYLHANYVIHILPKRHIESRFMIKVFVSIYYALVLNITNWVLLQQ